MTHDGVVSPMQRLFTFLFSIGLWRLGLVVLILLGVLREVSLPAGFESVFFAQYCRLRTEPAPAPVVVVAIDSASLKQVGEWPWPRTLLAEGVRSAAASGARSIGLQLYFPAREWNSGLAGLQTLADTLPVTPETEPIKHSLLDMAQNIDGDRQLQEALVTAGNVVLPWRISAHAPLAGAPLLIDALTINTPTLYWQERLAALHNPFAASAQSSHTVGVQESYAGLVKSAAASGGLGPLRADGTFDLLVPVSDHNRLLPSFALQLARQQIAPDAELRLNGDRLFLAGSRLNAGEGFGIRVNPQRLGQLPVYSYVDLVNGRLPAAALQGKAVVFGLERAEGPESLLVTAAIVADLLSATTLYRPHWAFLLEAAIVLYLGIFLVLIIPRISLRLGLLLFFFFLFSWLAIIAVLLVSQGLWFHPVPAVILVLVGSGLTLLSRSGGHAARNYDDLKLLGLSLQGQGMLDMAFDKFLQCPVRNVSVRELLYNLALDFERKRMFNKAEAVYLHILTAGSFKDVRNRLASLQQSEQTVVLGSGRDTGLALGNGQTRPTLGRYEILRELGQGAMGTVYLGRDPKINRDVAIKTLNFRNLEAQQVGEIKARFFREAEAAGRLNHSNIVTIYDAGEEHDLAYMAMEFLPGDTLAAHCQRDKLLAPAEVLRIAADIAAALDYAHEHEVVHRDIKPSNIMLLPDGRIKVTDFGIARVVSASQTQTGVVLGTPSYMSPEQVAGKKVDGRSDLFSLGVVCYELLCGEKPFTGENLGALMYSISNGDYAPLAERAPKKLSACCLDIVTKLLSKAVSRRYKTAAEVEQALRACRAKMR
jgi:serine/threonine-protein kinase